MNLNNNSQESIEIFIDRSTSISILALWLAYRWRNKYLVIVLITSLIFGCLNLIGVNMLLLDIARMGYIGVMGVSLGAVFKEEIHMRQQFKHLTSRFKAN